MRAEYIGKEKGKYRNVNIAWQTGTIVDEHDRLNNKVSDLGNNEYKNACDTLLFPMVTEFKPDIILISSGFDGGLHDMLGWSQLTSIQYENMTS